MLRRRASQRCARARPDGWPLDAGHSMISNQRFDALQKACAPWGNDDVKKPACASELSAANGEIGDFDVYNIYDTCAGDTLAAGEGSSWARSLAEWNAAMGQSEVEVPNDPATPAAHPQLAARRSRSASPHEALGAALNDCASAGI
eukprot:360172-Prymnesium_polylepis.1